MAGLIFEPIYWWVNIAKVMGFTAILIGLFLLVLTLISYFGTA
jgi:hypothetical protein